MALYVYITEDCRTIAQKHNCLKEVESLKKRVEEAQRLCHFDNFPPPYLKKRFKRQIRLLGDFQSIRIDETDHTVVCLLTIILRGSPDYEKFLKDPVGYGEKHLKPLVAENEIESFLDACLQEQPIAPLPEPSDSEYGYLYELLGSGQNNSTDEIVCESREWIEKANTDKIQNILVILCEHISGLLSKQDDNISKIKGRNLKVVYRYFPNTKKLFLAGIAENDLEHKELLDKYKDVLSPRGSMSEEVILKNSMRAYPSFLLASENDWIDIQKDTEANLALSPEETKVLESVCVNENECPGFPLFINGRAGSGKSTILYYLFTNYLNYYIQRFKDGESKLAPPLLLSCSKELVDRAKRTIRNLLEVHYQWKFEHGSNLTNEEVANKCFNEFKELLYSYLTYDERKQRFNEGGYVNYAHFRKLWEEKFGQNQEMKKYGPDLCWHIIRTFIKGNNPEDYMDPDDYDELPAKQKSVSYKVFSEVYKRVWDKWYKQLSTSREPDHWDDQDLARYIFEKKRIQAEYSAVFCDEAQDFTPVELDIIYGLSIFTKRDIGYSQDVISRIPFAFAGDPFQTLNPTGFRWDAIRASFHEKLLDSINTDRRAQIMFNYQELNMNYRSSKNIVKLCNFIQLFRATLFRIPNLRPQTIWHFESNPPYPLWFDREQPSSWEKLREEQDITIIVPCMFGEEIDYVKEDSLLSEIVRRDEEGIPSNVLSAARAKGLEFSRVLLYGFGDSIPEKVFDLMVYNGSDIDDNLKLQSEYFFNRLYVAASRPKRRLFIIDSKTGMEKLWKYSQEELVEKHFFPDSVSFHKSQWKGSIGSYQVGTQGNWNEDRGNIAENAKRFENQGLAQNDAYFLKSAALSYEQIDNKIKADYCRAHAFKMEGSYKKAGNHFAAAKEIDKSLSCYWMINDEPGIERLAKDYPEVAQKLEFKFINTLSNLNFKNVIKRMEELLEFIDLSANKRRFLKEKTWSVVLWKYIQKLFAKHDSWPNKQESIKLSSILQILINDGMDNNINIYTRVLFEAGKYEEIVKVCEEIGNTKLGVYNKSRNKILFKNYAGKSTENFTPKDWETVGNQLKDQGQYLEMFKCFWKSENISKIEETLNSIPKDYEEWQEVVRIWIDALAKNLEWKRINSLVMYSLNKPKRTRIKPEIRNILSVHTNEVFIAFVIVCALNKSLADQDNQVKKVTSDILNRSLISKSKLPKGISIYAAGSAIEHAGRTMDALQFYENMISMSGISSSEKKFGQERWIVTKEKQVEFEETSGSEIKAKMLLEEVHLKRAKYGIEGKKIHEYPVVKKSWIFSDSRDNPPRSVVNTQNMPEMKHEKEQMGDVPKRKKAISDITERKDDNALDGVLSDITIQDLRLELRRKNNRINITNEKTSEIASILFKKKVFNSVDVKISQTNGIFVCEEWAIECDFSKIDVEGVVILDFGIIGVQLKVKSHLEDK